jgi:signal transduction histidine kinase
MPSHQSLPDRHSPAPNRKFPLLKYFSIASLVCTLVTAVVLGLLYRHHAVNELIAQAERESTQFAQELASLLETDIASLLDLTIAGNNRVKVIERIDQIVRAEAKFHTTAKVKIYTGDGLTLYSTHRGEIGRVAKDNPGVLGASHGKVTSGIVYRDQFNAFDQVIENRNLLQIYLPISGRNPSQVVGVFELYSDITGLLGRIRSAEQVVIASVTGALLVLYGLLFMIVYRADRIITRQDKALKEQLEEINRYSITLEDRVKERTDALKSAYDRLSAEVAEREDAQKELELARQHAWQQDKLAAIGRLAAGIVHEIGNPLAAARGLVDVASENLAEGDVKSGVTLLGQAKDQLERLERITRDVTDFTMPNGRAMEVVNLNELISRAITVLRYDIRLSNVPIRMTVDHDLPAISGIPDQLWQVVMNLVLNAADAVARRKAQDATITVSTRRVNGSAVLIVGDQGDGMTADALAKAFEPFQTKKAPGEGMGIGLSLCYSIVRRHGGDISINSSPQAGTTVSVTLPLADTKAGTPPVA